jgi:hypothetical protein
MKWTHVTLEAYCDSPVNNELALCGRDAPCSDCLKDGGCPYLLTGDATLREGAEFVPLRLIIWDRIKRWFENTISLLRWIGWDRYHELPFSDEPREIYKPTVEDKKEESNMKRRYRRWARGIKDV